MPMPELPEVETVVRTLRPQVLHRCIRRVDLLRPSQVHPLSLPLTTLEGRQIVEVTRRGKLVLLHLAAPASCPQIAAVAPDVPELLAVHLRMTGRLMTHPDGTPPHAHSRCLFYLDGADGPSVLFFDDVRAFGLLFAATPALLQRWDFWRRMGPEPLEHPAATLGADLFSRLHTRRTALKALLLDQSVLAGIGNIYADESLFQAGLDPRRPGASLALPEWQQLCAALQAVLRLSIAQCGSSIRDYRDANGHVGAFQNSFAVYGRGGEPCTRCGRPLVRTRVAGRTTIFCPSCQH